MSAPSLRSDPPREHSLPEIPSIEPHPFNITQGNRSDEECPCTCHSSAKSNNSRTSQPHANFITGWNRSFKRYRPQLLTAWKGGIGLNICIALVVLIINISFPSWAVSNYGPHQGYLFHGSCTKVERLATLGHAIINILGTLLLSASNYTMQVLAAPTRADVDHAHRQKKSLSIGVQAFRNIRSFGPRRATLWLLLGVSSIPLHLLYNSVIFPVNGAHAYIAVLVTSNFQKGVPFDLTLANDMRASTSDPLFSTGYRSYKMDPAASLGYSPPSINPSDDAVVLALQDKAQKNQLLEMTKEDCLQTYSTPFQRRYRNVIAVSDNARSNSSVVWLEYSSPAGANFSSWVCVYESPNDEAEQFPDKTCTPPHTISISSDWSLGFYSMWSDGRWYLGSHPITRCLVEPAPSPCALKYDRRVLLTVVVANLVKVLAMAATMLQYKRPALVTVGDALASFLEIPDNTTPGMCLAKKKDFLTKNWSAEPRGYVEDRRDALRSSGASRLQWLTTFGLFIFSGMVAAMAFALIYNDDTKIDWSFNRSVEPNAIKTGRGLNNAALLVLANLPQLLVSFDYILLNRLATCMAGSYEWSLFAYQRKGLRTSQTSGAQRSTYWLQLPLKFSLPMMAVSATLHYIVSQSLYFISVQYLAHYDHNGSQVILEDYTGLGYSQTAIHVLMVVLALPITAAVLLGRRHNKLGIPPAGFNSAAISAACHPPPEEEDVHLKPVQWGEVTQCGDSNDIGHCSFSSRDVMLPVEGRKYM